MMAERTGANRNYNTAAIRKLLFEACSDEELTILCYDYFRPVHDQFAAGMSRGWKIYLLLDYCEKQGQLDELLKRIQEINPKQVAQFVPLIKVSDQAASVETSLRDREAPPIVPVGPLDIIKVGHIPLTRQEEAVLQTLYSRYGQIGIETEFGSGLSGSRVFRVRLEEYLPEAVKIAPIAIIEKERQAYQVWVENKLYNIARIQPAPDSPPGGGLSGLRYDLVGGGSVDVQSLSAYYRETNADNLSKVLKRLFAEMSDKWWLNTRQVRRLFQMKTDYDALLPVNAEIKPIDAPLDSPAPTLTPDNLPTLKAENFLKLEGLVITEVDHSRRQVTLNLPPSSPGTPQKSYRLRLVEVPNLSDYQEGARVGPIYGQVKATRRDLLVNQAHQALGEGFDLSAEKLKSGGLTLPNPLLVVEDYLDKLRTVRISTIHGDLNLENILVDRDTGAVKLIDFATVRAGHSLHDLLRLETEVVTKLIPTALSEANVPPEKSASLCHDLYNQLHQASFHLDQLPHPSLKKPVAMLVAIREMARKCLYNPDDWTEYYQGLTLYLLGALKFKNLDAQAKQVAFWAAATLVHGPSLKPPPPEYAYDVFISYSQADIEWVQDELLPRLEAADLKVFIDFRDFVPGEASLTSTEQGVSESRHTLVVLTPAWIESEWREFESVLAGTSDPAGRRRRVVPLKLAPCQPSPRIAMLVGVDLTDPARQEQEMARLLRGLGGKSA